MILFEIKVAVALLSTKNMCWAGDPLHANAPLLGRQTTFHLTKWRPLLTSLLF